MRLILAGCLALMSTAVAEDRDVLPGTAKPLSYKIEIAPDTAAMMFAGKAEIAIEVVSATDKLVLNARDIQIDSVKLSGTDATPLISFDEKRQEVTFTYPAAIEPGPRTLAIAYRGKIFETSSGLFVTPYTDNGVKKVMLTTQFEPGDARRLAPMWDEPAAKAVFEMSLVVPDNLDTLSNTIIASTEPVEGGKKRVRYQPTPKMSSYLLFLAAGEMDRITTTADGVEIGVVTRKGDIERYNNSTSV